MRERAERIPVLSNIEGEQILGNFMYLFPGQGVEGAGMGKNLYENSTTAQGILDQLNPELLEIMFNELSDESTNALNDTSNAQPATVAVSLATYSVFLEKNPLFKRRLPRAFLGHSTGQMSAIAAAGVVDIKTVLDMAAERGRLMKEVGGKKKNKGGMLALGTTLEKAESLCSDTSQALGEEGIWVANDNSVDQIILSGRENHIVYAAAHAKDIGINKTKRLRVPIAAHCPLMQEAQDLFAQYLDTVKFEKPTSPIILNTTAAATLDPDAIKTDLISGLTCGVKFREALQEAQRSGVISFIEFGEGPLSGFARKLMPDSVRLQMTP